MITLLLASLALAGPAADASRPSLQSLSSVHDAAWVEARNQAMGEVDRASLDALALDADWRVGLTAQALRAWQDQPDRAGDTWVAPPVSRRDGALMFRGDGLAPVIGERLQHGGESVATRLALVDWLRRSTATWPPWADTAWADEPDAQVRAAWIDAARYLGATDRLAGADGRKVVTAGFGDADVRVRAASARVAAYLDAPEHLRALARATADPSDEVAGLAARSLGLLRAGGVYESVAGVLERSDATARLWTVRALQRLDAARAAADPRVAALTADPDPRVARAASEVTAP